MKTKFSLVVLVVVLVIAAAVPSAAAPLSNPCAPGAAYNSACDVDQNGQINVTDIQLTAGHWNQTGTFTSDNNHNHLGQTWTGSNNPLVIQGSFGPPSWAPLILGNTGGVGVRVNAPGGSGVWVESAGNNGVLVDSAGNDGLFVCHTGSASSCTPNPTQNGVEIGRSQDDGLHVSIAGGDGVYVDQAAFAGLRVISAGSSAMIVYNATNSGLLVQTAGNNGVNVSGNNYAGYFAGSIYVTGSCIGCLQANFAVNAGGRSLQPGDVVSIQSVTITDFDAGTNLWQVVPTQPGQAVVGVVAGRAELVTEADHRPNETGKRLVPREGAAQPGDYVTIVYSGPMQVKVAPDASSIAAGARLTVAADGSVRPLQTRTVEGMVVTEGAPAIGMALEAPKDGMVWVLVNPQ